MRPSRPPGRLAALIALSVAVGLAPGASARTGASGEAGSGPGTWRPSAGAARVLAAESGVKWSDVGRNHWARAAVDHVAGANNWMRDFPENKDGTYPFKPHKVEPRRLFARAVVRALAPDEPTDPDLRFDDLPKSDRFWPYANVAVKLGWMTRSAGKFLPDGDVTTRTVHRALVLALEFRGIAADLDRLQTTDGKRFDTPRDFGTTLLGMRLGLRYNHSDEALDVGPTTPLPRAEVAWSLYRAATIDPDYATSATALYEDIELPRLSDAKRRIVKFGVRYVGYPYVWGGEWEDRTPDGYCCGAQPVGGFDCSGWTWWIVKKAAGSWDNTPPRDYRGWTLAERSSLDMSRTGDRIGWKGIKPGDLLFYDGSGDGKVDHVDVYIGNGWALDSSSGVGGVTIVNVAQGWYRDHFHHARRIIG